MLTDAAVALPIVVAQRERIAELLRQIGVPEFTPAQTRTSATKL